MFTNPTHPKGAIAILTLLGVIIFAMLMMTTLATLAASEARMSTADSNTTETFYAAEAGLNIKLYEMASGVPIPMPEISGITPMVTIVPVGFQSRILSEASDSSGKVRRVELTLISSSGGFTSAVQAGDGGIIFNASGAVINGDVYSNGPICNGTWVDTEAGPECHAAGSVSTINGDVTVAAPDTILGGPVTVNGTTTLGAEEAPMPIDINIMNKWKADILAYGNPVSGTTVISSPTTLGWQKIDGDLVVDTNQRLTMSGSIWVTGDVIFNNNSKVFISHTLTSITEPQPPSLVLLADGIIDASQNVTLCGSGCVDPPTTISVVSGGNLISGTDYFYKVTAIIGGNETAAWKEVVETPNPGKRTIDLSWPAIASADFYNVYRSNTSEEYNDSSLIGNPTTNAFTDDGSLTPSAGKPPINFLLVVSSNASVDPAAPAIAASNNSDSAIFSAPYGMLDVKHGAINAGSSYVLQMETNTVVNYRPEIASIFIPSDDDQLTVAPSSWREK